MISLPGTPAVSVLVGLLLSLPMNIYVAGFIFWVCSLLLHF